MTSTTSSAVPILAALGFFIAAYFLFRHSRKRDDDWITKDRHGVGEQRPEQSTEMNWHPGRDYDLTMKEWLEINSRRD